MTKNMVMMHSKHIIKKAMGRTVRMRIEEWQAENR